MDSISAEYEPGYDAPHESRALVREFLAQHDAGDLAFIGELLMSELVANVVRHAHSPIRVDLTWDSDTLRADVQDGSSILPAVSDLGTEEAGYGLRIVDALADDWGVQQLEQGKAVWFTVNRKSAGIAGS